MRVMDLAERFGFPLVVADRHARRLPRRRRRAARPGRRDRALPGADDRARRADGRVRDRRGRLGRRARARGLRPGADAGERDLLGDHPGGVRDDPLARSASEKKKAAAAFKPDAFHCLRARRDRRRSSRSRAAARRRTRTRPPRASRRRSMRALDEARGDARRRSCGGRGARSSAPWASSPDLELLRRSAPLSPHHPQGFQPGIDMCVNGAE